MVPENPIRRSRYPETAQQARWDVPENPIWAVKKQGVPDNPIRAFLITRNIDRPSRIHMKKQANAESAVRQRAS
jgi:hypothetical protein